MEELNIRIIGANDDVLHVHGEEAGAEGIALLEGQVKGLWDMPVDTEWASARREFGEHLQGVEYPAADVILGFGVSGSRGGTTYIDAHSRLRDCFTYELDRWDPEAKLARIEVEADGGYRFREVQLFEHPDFEPERDASKQDYGLTILSLRAGNPAWRTPDVVTSWETDGTSDAGEIEVYNPTNLPMMQTWVLTRGTWTVPDFSWTGAPYIRRPGGEFGDRRITLQPITAQQGGVRINYNPMRLMIEDWAGTNVLGQVGGGYFFLQENVIPPRTPRQTLPISVSGAPSGGARAELHQPRWWTTPFGGW